MLSKRKGIKNMREIGISRIKVFDIEVFFMYVGELGEFS